MSELNVESVSISYGETEALRSVDLRVGSGEVVAVIGPSGCGKSSLLRAIAGLEPVAGGSISLGGRDLVKVPTHKRDLGLMFQDHALFPHLDVAGNVAFGLRMQKMERVDRSERVAEVLDLVGLGRFAERSIDELSGGEAQRVALARALAPSPGLLMLDEPLGSLDRLLRHQLVGDLRLLFAELGVTALHVTHDQSEAFALADRVVILRDGRVVQVGRPADIWKSPKSAFVAEFLGHKNVWELAGESVLVPLPAITAVRESDDLRSSERAVLVERVEFSEGRFRVSARSQTPTLCGLAVGHVPVVFDMTVEPAVGTNIVLELDARQIVMF